MNEREFWWASAKLSIQLVAFVVILIAILWAFAAISQEMPMTHTHEGVVGEFYQTWKRPPGRIMGCCNQTDCRPVLEARKRGNGQTEVRVADFPGWYPVPENVWEDAQGDPRESPDGRMHVCIYVGNVICAVRESEI